MIEIDDKHKQILQWAVQAYYEDYLEMRNEKLEELKALDESISELKTILTTLGLPPKEVQIEALRGVVPNIDPSVIHQKESENNGTVLVVVDEAKGLMKQSEQKSEQQPQKIEQPEKIEQTANLNRTLSPLNKENVLRPDDLKQDPFEYDKTQMTSYEMIFFHELPDNSGRVVIEYSGAHYYTTKEDVMKIPYPFPVKYFSRENGWSSTVEQAFKKYRKYLAEQELIEIRKKQEDGNVKQQSPLQKLKELAAPGITKEDLTVDWFECDPSEGKEIKGHENCKVVELLDGRAMVQYKGGTHYYTTKEKVMKIPYPIPKGFFKGSGLSTIAEVCIRAYRHYLEVEGVTKKLPQEMQGRSSEDKDGGSGVQETKGEKSEGVIEEPKTEKPKLEFFKEDSGFDYASAKPQYIGGSTVYRSNAGKLVVKHQGKNTQGELLLTKDSDIEKLMNYDEKEVDWVIRSLSAEKRNILRGYLKDLKALNQVVQ